MWLTPLRVALHYLFSIPVRIAIVSGKASPTDLELTSVRARGLEVVHVTPGDAVASLSPTDVALGRLDVRPELDGVEDGLWSLGVLAARGITVLNAPGTLLEPRVGLERFGELPAPQ